MENAREFLCIVQTHSLSNSQKGKERYCGAPKAEVTRRCVASLVASINFAQSKFPMVTFKLDVLDDHSDTATVAALKDILSRAKFPTTFVELQTHGIMPSILACYERGSRLGKDLVYFAQDDYLYFESAIAEMIEFEKLANMKVGSPVSLYPFNDPYRYWDINVGETVRLVQGAQRHWRTNYHSASCFMTHHKIITDNWDLFYKMGTSEVRPGMETDSIDQLWQKRGYVLFSPIPSLALHMQFETEKDPYLNWHELWEKFAQENEPAQYPLDPTKKVIVNVGCGRSPLPIPLLQTGEWQEVRVDTDPGATPHILAPMDKMPQIPSNSVDAIWASHVLEHVFWHEIPRVLGEFRRVLKPTGVAIISVPDLQDAAKMIAEDRLLDVAYESNSGPIAPIDMLYGYREFTRLGMPGMMHKSGFTASTLEQVLRSLGFSHVLCKREGWQIKGFASHSPLESNLLLQVA
jgi:hypothetical protein